MSLYLSVQFVLTHERNPLLCANISPAVKESATKISFHLLEDIPPFMAAGKERREETRRR
jgi:hypothetical protein